MLLIHQFDDRYDFAFGETRIRLPLHLLRCTTRSFESVRERARTCTGSNKRLGTLGVIAFALQPATAGATSDDTRSRDSVEPRRLELLTSSLQRRRSTS